MITAIITLLVVVLVFVYLIQKLSQKGQKWDKIYSLYSNEYKIVSKQDKSDKTTPYLSKIRVFLIYLTVFLFLILFFTGFIPTLFSDNILTGLPLIIHVTAAPLFAVTLSLLILLFSFSQRLNKADFENLRDIKNLLNIDPKTIIKTSFWLITFFSIPLLTSIILILFPILGTELQKFNIIVHRLSATIITCVLFLLLFADILRRKSNS